VTQLVVNAHAGLPTVSRHPSAAWLLAAILLWWPLQLAAQAQPGTAACADCHEEGAKLSVSAHARVECARCHPKHEEYPHPANISKATCNSCHQPQSAMHGVSVHGQKLREGNAGAPDCAMCHGSAHEVTRARTAEFHRQVPETCGMCHDEVKEHFLASVHGKAVTAGVANAPVCTDCHGEHSILPSKAQASTVNPRNIRETCGRCHGDIRLMRRFGLPVDRLTSFDESFHGLAARGGSQTVANCASCHGFHDVLPSKDPRSMTNPDNLSRTCGQCHPGAGRRFALGPVHAPVDGDEPAPIRYARLFYRILIPITIGWMLLHHGGDWIRKLRRLRLAGTAAAIMARATPTHGPERMYGSERVQHAALAVSFIVLVWSGFALKYPEQWWAWPLVAWEAYGPVRGLVHRAAGVVMLVVAAVHVLSVILSRRLREHWKELLPRRLDATDAVQWTLYNLGLRRQAPDRRGHGYIEKAEYWAVVWGTALMGLTGVMLWANNLMLEWFPKMILDLALTLHFYEAVLAALAILVWHLYSVIFDPDVYPMDMAWLTGVSPRNGAIHLEPEPGNPNVEGEAPEHEG